MSDLKLTAADLRWLREIEASMEPSICDQATALALQDAAIRTMERDAAVVWAKREHRAFVKASIIAVVVAIAAWGWFMAWLVKK